MPPSLRMMLDAFAVYSFFGLSFGIYYLYNGCNLNITSYCPLYTEYTGNITRVDIKRVHDCYSDGEEYTHCYRVNVMADSFSGMCKLGISGGASPKEVKSAIAHYPVNSTIHWMQKRGVSECETIERVSNKFTGGILSIIGGVLSMITWITTARYFLNGEYVRMVINRDGDVELPIVLHDPEYDGPNSSESNSG
jgi:hypothetical protein